MLQEMHNLLTFTWSCVIVKVGVILNEKERYW